VKLGSFRGSQAQKSITINKMKMRIVSKFVAAGLVMLAVGETCSYAAPGIVGVNYGPYHKPGQDPNRPDDPRLPTLSFGRI
jgi:hypothetical protein